MGNKYNPHNNTSGYADPTAYEALKRATEAEKVLETKANFTLKVLKFIASEAGFDIMTQLELRDRRSGRVFKSR